MARAVHATEFPLPLCEVLEQELQVLRPEAGGPSLEPGTLSPWDFTPGQIRTEGLPGLLARLHDPGDEVCRRLAKRLSTDFRSRLEQQGRPGGPCAEELRKDLAAELNRLLHQDDLSGELAMDLAEACRKERIRLSDEMEMLLADPPEDRPRLRRLLLEEIFCSELEKVCDRRLGAVYRRVHDHPDGLSALCLSGGGIRSAVFGLGVIQGLARRGLLHGFDYLSTVSGGGYLGGMLSAWIHRHPRGLDGVSDELGGRPPAEDRKLQPEAAPMDHLRSFSNYLTPKLGMLSADSWTLVSIFVRNLYVYWLVLVPLLLAVLGVPRLYAALVTAKITPWPASGFTLSGLGPVYLMPDGLFLLGSLLMSVALAYIGWNRPSGGRRSTPLGFLRVCLLPLTASAVLLTLYWAFYQGLGRGEPGWPWFVFPAVAINVFGWSVHAVPALAKGRVRPLTKLQELPLLVAAGALGGLLTLLAAKAFRDPGAPGGDWSSYVPPWYSVFAVPCVLVAFVLGEALFVGLASRWTADEDREWWSRSAAWMLIVAAVWIAVSSVVIYGPVLLSYWRWVLTPVGGLAGVATALLARSSLTSESSAGKDKSGPLATALDTALAFVAPIFVLVLTSALSLGVSALLSLVTGQPIPGLSDTGAFALWHIRLVSDTKTETVLAFLGATLGTGLLMALLIDINKFSLHAMYRNRLIRTFLGASRENRRPNAFTGFDGEDNLEIWRLRMPLFLRRENLEAEGARLCQRLQESSRSPSAEIVSRHLSEESRRLLGQYDRPKKPSEELLEALTADFNRMIRGRFDEPLLRGLKMTDEEREQLRRAPSDDERYRLQRDRLLQAFQEEIDTSRPPRPLHVVNVALNLVGGKKLAWQQRKAEPFTFSPLHSGSLRVGYRPSDRFAVGGSQRQAVSLGTAMAISGAAASPNMGYHSSPAITFLMTFFNARLGWWLGNPGVAGAHTFTRAQPALAIRPLISEALGLTDDRNPYVYLSDGGHFENLGLYEMVLRRCRHIVVVDAGQDPGCRFEDLGNALRKIRIDLGIRIRLDKMLIRGEMAKGEVSRYCAVGEILYSDVDPNAADGKLLYLKPTLCGGEPQDVLHYKELNKTFPHESTGDQWFSEQQFESYRALGLHAVEAICGAAEKEARPIDSLAALFDEAERYASDTPPSAPKKKRSKKVVDFPAPVADIG